MTVRYDYVRFGSLPEGVSRNHRDGLAEVGVSAYRAKWDDDGYLIDLSDLDPVGLWSAVQIVWGDRPMYGLTGTEVGRGADGEPCLDPETVNATRLPYEDTARAVIMPGGAIAGSADAAMRLIP